MGDLEEKLRCADAFDDELTVLQVSQLFPGSIAPC